MNTRSRFSQRHGFESQAVELSVRYEAPDNLRQAVPQIAYEAGLQPSNVREVICRIVSKAPNSQNWSERPNIAEEVEYHFGACEWFEVYDAIEVLYALLLARGEVSLDPEIKSRSKYFEDEINTVFRRFGIGWKLEDGQIQIRGEKEFESVVKEARTELESAGRSTAETELKQALDDLSKRPEPDLTGAIQHSMAALECVARDATGDPKATLGEILKKNPELVPKPLDQALHKAWGFASQKGRHLEEGNEPDVLEVELVVGLSAVVTMYLSKKYSN